MHFGMGCRHWHGKCTLHQALPGFWQQAAKQGYVFIRSANQDAADAFFFKKADCKVHRIFHVAVHQFLGIARAPRHASPPTRNGGSTSPLGMFDGFPNGSFLFMQVAEVEVKQTRSLFVDQNNAIPAVTVRQTGKQTHAWAVTNMNPIPYWQSQRKCPEESLRRAGKYSHATTGPVILVVEKMLHSSNILGQVHQLQQISKPQAVSIGVAFGWFCIQVHTENRRGG